MSQVRQHRLQDRLQMAPIDMYLCVIRYHMLGRDVRRQTYVGRHPSHVHALSGRIQSDIYRALPGHHVST